MKSYFYGKTKGLNADIARHREHEQELQAKIASLEGKNDEMSKRSLAAHRHFLNQLWASKAAVLEKLGKKK